MGATTAAAVDKVKDTKSAISFIEKANTKDDLFAGGDEDKIFKKLFRYVHPDVLSKQPNAIKKRGEDAAYKLNRLHHHDKKTASPAIFGQWVVEETICAGDIADIYQVTSRKIILPNVMKVVRHPRDNDLLEAEISALKTLHDDKRSDNFKLYLPTVVDRFKASDRAAVVMTKARQALKDPGVFEDLVPLSEIVRKLKGEIDFRHLVWMSNRILSALGFAHMNGIVHGAVVPPHMLLGPLSHGLHLIDWCYSVTGVSKKHIPAIVPAYKKHYPKEVFRKTPPTPATDIYMWAYMIRAIAGKSTPHRFKGLFDWCLADAPIHRPQDAWKLQDQWGSLAKEEFGPSKYLKLSLPVV